ncbi:MAG: ATP-dependent DNA helicase RecG [Bacteroidales bacterium]|nr:ATP-dependent DNA helicase RecG [Bacteroidales bacterium]
MPTELKYIKGIGPRRADVLAREADIHSPEDVIEYFPYRYVDRSRIYTIRELTADMSYVQLIGRFVSKEVVGQGTKRRLSARFVDGTGSMEVVWFRGLNYVEGQINTSDEYLLFGKPSIFMGRMNMAHPDIERNPDRLQFSGKLMPMYNTTEGMKRAMITSKTMQGIVESVFAAVGTGAIRETLPAQLVARHNLMPRPQALWAIHFPTDLKTLDAARFRLKFEELFYIQLALLRSRNLNRSQVEGIRFTSPGPMLGSFYKDHLKFEPTGAQKRVVHEVWGDFKSGKQMNRLVQGDVGSGKTLVALLCMLIVTGNGMQACLMAPTEILANQHYESLVAELRGMDVGVALLTGSVKGKKRKAILDGLAGGSIGIVVGTHALIGPTVVFKNLALCVIDEQHRFGVAQRASLWTKNSRPPHILVMTATPIPRTLAMTIYGDLDVSVIDEMPPGRKPVFTEHYFYCNRNRLNAFIRSELQKGRQAYVVFPLIKENEKMDYKNLEEGFRYMKESFAEYKVCMVHGKLSADDKDEAMRQFVSGEAQIMVATTVIEVGVNVPNASVMVIESAERFGLSQLHQLRGRVGRGADQSFCILMTANELGRDTRRRIEIMCQTTDGFAIAEADMRLRGPGDIEGTQQSGIPFRLKISDLARDSQILSFARDCAKEVLAQDPMLASPQSVVMTQRLAELQNDTVNWSRIS